MTEEDIWEPRKNLGNAEDPVREFKEEYDEIRRVRKRKNNKEDRKGELPGRYTAKILYRWNDKKFDKEYWGRLEKNWKKWKGKEKKRLMKKRKKKLKKKE